MNRKNRLTRFVQSARSFRITRSNSPLIVVLLFPALILALSFSAPAASSGQSDSDSISLKRKVTAPDLGVAQPAGLAFSSATSAFHVIEADRQASPASVTSFAQLTSLEQEGRVAHVSAAIDDPINLTFDGHYNRLLIYDSAANQLIELRADAAGALDPATMVRHDVSHFGLQNAQGMTVDPASGALFVLNTATPSIVRVEPAADGGFASALIAELDLQSAGLNNPRGLALDPSTGNLHVLSLGTQQLVELTPSAEVVATRNLSEFGLSYPLGMVFAPSGDQTDAPSQTSLYLLDSTARLQSDWSLNDSGDASILEFSFVSLPQADPDEVTFDSQLVQTIQAWQWDPPSTDTSDVVYLPASNSFLACDSEVNELPEFTGSNLFRFSSSGALLETFTTISFSPEPTGCAINPANNHLFISDDQGQSEVYVVDPGPDGDYNTPDDSVTSFSVDAFLGPTGDADAEDVAFGDGLLFVSDGDNAEVYVVDPGPNGVFDGVAPEGDDQVTSFDTASLGMDNTEGVAYNSSTGTLYVGGRTQNIGSSNYDTVLEVTTDGTLVQLIDISPVRRPGQKISGLGVGPSSVDPTKLSLWIADRGYDADFEPDDYVDGRIYEMSLPDEDVTLPTPTSTSTAGPTPTATATSTPGPSPTATATNTPGPSPTATATGTPVPPGDEFIYLPFIASDQ